MRFFHSHGVWQYLPQSASIAMITIVNTQVQASPAPTAHANIDIRDSAPVTVVIVGSKKY